jgi:uncharacterized protein
MLLPLSLSPMAEPKGNRGEKLSSIKSWNLLDTYASNKYLYDRQKKRVHLLHPLLHYIIKMINEGKDVLTWLEAIAEESVQIEGCGSFTKKEIDYYYQKYLLLKKSGYFSEINQEEKLSAGLLPRNIKESLANAKQITFEVTDSCNLECEYCGYGKFYNDYDKRENKNLDIPSAKRFLDYLVELWNSPLNRSHNRNIYISFYGGEPLLNMPFIRAIVDYVNRLEAKHNRFTFSMTTNGLLLEKYVDYLYENRFNLLISLDGNEKNNQYRVLKNGKPAYKIILENIKKLKEKYPDYFINKVNFNAVLHNINSVSDIYHYFKENFDKTPTVGTLNTSGIKETKKEDFMKMFSNVNESLYKSEDYSSIEKDMFIKLPNSQGVMIFLHQYNDFCYNDYNALLYSTPAQIRIPTGTCLPFTKKIFVTVNGKILPCERISQQYDLGYVTADRVELDFDRIAEKYNGYFDKMRKVCHVCHESDNCKQCIFKIDTINHKHPSCNLLSKEKDKTKYVSTIISQIEAQPEIYSRILKEVVIA